MIAGFISRKNFVKPMTFFECAVKSLFVHSNNSFKIKLTNRRIERGFVLLAWSTQCLTNTFFFDRRPKSIPTPSSPRPLASLELRRSGAAGQLAEGVYR